MGPVGSLVAVARSLLGNAFVYPPSPKGLDANGVIQLDTNARLFSR